MFICPECGGDNVHAITFRDPRLYDADREYIGSAAIGDNLKGALNTFEYRRQRECRDCGVRFITTERFERYVARRKGAYRHG